MCVVYTGFSMIKSVGNFATEPQLQNREAFNALKKNCKNPQQLATQFELDELQIIRKK